MSRDEEERLLKVATPIAASMARLIYDRERRPERMEEVHLDLAKQAVDLAQKLIKQVRDSGRMPRASLPMRLDEDESDELILGLLAPC